MKISIRTGERSPMGAVTFSARRFGYSDTWFYWNGPGARLQLMFGAKLVYIEHPSADGTYNTLKEAQAAARRFCEVR